MDQPATCGHLYRQLTHTLFPGTTEDETYHALLVQRPEGTVGFAGYALGFLGGQAEKVASGACAPFMSRPSQAWWQWAGEAMHLVCATYGLVLVCNEAQGEYWGCRTQAVAEEVRTLLEAVERNSLEWHRRRGRLCGIAEIDFHYHTRPGHGGWCEPDGCLKGGA